MSRTREELSFEGRFTQLWKIVERLAREGATAKATIGVQATKTSDQDTATGVIEVVEFDGADAFDDHEMHDPISSNTRLTASTAGIFLFVGHIVFAATGGLKYTDILFNGATIVDATEIPAGVQHIGTLGIKAMAVGDFVELRGRQASGGSMNILAADTIFSAVRLA